MPTHATLWSFDVLLPLDLVTQLLQVKLCYKGILLVGLSLTPFG